MPNRVRISFTARGNNAFFNTPNGRLSVNVTGLQSFRNALINEVITEIRRTLIPYVKNRTQVRTGNLKNSIRVIRTPNGFRIIGSFYGAFQNPSTRDLVYTWVRSNYQSLILRVARRLTNQI